MNDRALEAKLIATADRCVKCGLCLPHCPTYRVSEDEGESPRGRIALIQGLAEDKLSLSPRLRAHLDSCLACRACEAVCPSLVAFGSLIDDTRSLQNRRSGFWRRGGKRAWLRVLSGSSGVRVASALSRLYRFSGLGRLVEGAGLPGGSRLGAYHRVAMQLDLPLPTPAVHAKGQASVQEVALFLGCVAQTAQPGLPRAACRVLARLGFHVRIPRAQCCCGAMHRHNGFPLEADSLLAQNASAFAGSRVVVTASACAAELRTHRDLHESLEICRLLADLQWPQDAPLRPLPARVAVHEPCSHRSVLRDGDAAYALLRRIPQIELVALEDDPWCCGAAGTYMLEQPTMATALLTRNIDRLQRLRPDFLVTTNTGCALHLAAGSREAGLDLEVLHPVELIERQLPTRPA